MTTLYEQVDNKTIFRPYKTSRFGAIFSGLFSIWSIVIILRLPFMNWASLMFVCILSLPIVWFLWEMQLIEYYLELDGDQLTQYVRLFKKTIYTRNTDINGHYCFFEESASRGGLYKLNLRVGEKSIFIAGVTSKEKQEAIDQLSRIFNG